MFGNLRLIAIFDNFLLPSQVDLSANCFYHFSTSNVLIKKMQQQIDFPMEIFSVEISNLAI